MQHIYHTVCCMYYDVCILHGIYHNVYSYCRIFCPLFCPYFRLIIPSVKTLQPPTMTSLLLHIQVVVRSLLLTMKLADIIIVLVILVIIRIVVDSLRISIRIMTLRPVHGFECVSVLTILPL